MAAIKVSAPWRQVVGTPLALALTGVVFALLTVYLPAPRRVAMICVGLGVLAATLGAAGIVLASALARRGMATREALVASFDAFQRWLPSLLTVQLSMVTLAFGAGVATMLVLGVVTADYRLAAVMGLLLLTVAGMLYVVVSSARAEAARFVPSPLAVLGCLLERERAPELWADVDAIADALGAPRVDNIISGVLDGFFVTSGEVYGGEGAILKGHTLYVSAAHLPLLHRDQLRAIVAHELAHFRGEDTLYSERFAPVYHGLQRRILAVGQYETDDWVGKIFLRPGRLVAAYGLAQFSLTEKHWSRLRELEADRIAAGVVGARAFAVALMRAVLLQTRLLKLLSSGVPAEHTNLIEAFTADVANDPPGDLGAERLAHPYDSHPLIRERLDHLGVTIDDALLAEAATLPPNNASAAVLDWPVMADALSTALMNAMRARRVIRAG